MEGKQSQAAAATLATIASTMHTPTRQDKTRQTRGNADDAQDIAVTAADVLVAYFEREHKQNTSPIASPPPSSFAYKDIVLDRQSSVLSPFLNGPFTLC